MMGHLSLPSLTSSSGAWDEIGKITLVLSNLSHCSFLIYLLMSFNSGSAGTASMCEHSLIWAMGKEQGTLIFCKERKTILQQNQGKGPAGCCVSSWVVFGGH